MKLSTNLTLSGQPAHLVDHDIVLDLSTGGRAALTIEGSATKGQTLTVDTGYNGELRRWFTGYVYDVQPAANGACKLLCRELAGMLGSKFPVSIQHATLRSLLAWLSEQPPSTRRRPPPRLRHGIRAHPLPPAGCTDKFFAKVDYRKTIGPDRARQRI